jgi:AraC family transcriptional activator of pobA
VWFRYRDCAAVTVGNFLTCLSMNETMTMNGTSLELINPQSKHLAFKWSAFEDGESFRGLNRFNYFSVILVLEGQGTVTADVSAFPFSDKSLLSFSLYQPFTIRPEGAFKGIMVNFHPEFFCLHKHRHEVSCNGVLFNNIYESPVIDLTDSEAGSLLTIMHGIGEEMRRPGIAQLEALLSYLKLLLINASRMKMERRSVGEGAAGANGATGAIGSAGALGSTGAAGSREKEPVLLGRLKAAIEEHFASLHSPGDYAGLLNISTAALNKVAKAHFNKTLSNLITERIITEAKRQLYLTAKPVKQIAFELGFNDEFYFSRFFKGKVAISPQFYRDTVGFDRANA